jgi:glycoside/pentoside/hexuronide:cation symporter, GPH family
VKTLAAATPAVHSAHGLAGWALFSAVIAAAGLPIYINAPKFYVDEYGVGLGALGVTLFVLRLIDVVQDPALGWLADRFQTQRGTFVATATLLAGLSMIALFAVQPPIAPILWFALALTVLFSSYSFLIIAFYAEGIRKAADLGPGGHIRLAAWREGGALLGVSLAAVAPFALAQLMPNPLTGFALGFAALALAAAYAMRREWAPQGKTVAQPAGVALGTILADPLSRRLLILALVNALPVAITSTLFLFFVESRLGATAASGPLLLLFFISAALSTPIWSRAAQRFGAKPVLLAGMAISVVSFLFASLLGAGDVLGFALICAASGAALGADTMLLPALFASRLAKVSPNAGAGFGLWNFVTKASLALVALSVLPLLESRGFQAGGTNTAEALAMLTFLYALLPCALKLVAIGLLAATPLQET